MSTRQKLFVVAAMLTAFGLAATVDAFRQRQRRVVELYWDKPDDCPNGARAFTLQGAWVTPTIGGAIVWACR